MQNQQMTSLDATAPTGTFVGKISLPVAQAVALGVHVGPVPQPAPLGAHRGPIPRPVPLPLKRFDFLATSGRGLSDDEKDLITQAMLRGGR